MVAEKGETATGCRPSRRQILVGSAVVTAGALGVPMPIRANSPLNIGVVLPLSGYLAQPGQACQRGVELAPRVLEPRGYSMRLTVADSESNPETARARAEQLINDGAHLLIGAFDSGQTGAVAQVCEQRGIPLVINIAAAPPLTEQGYRTIFRNFPTSINLIRNGLALMNDLFQFTGAAPKTAVFLHANDTFGRANKAALDAILPTVPVPFQLLDSISYDPRAQDLSVEVATAKASTADLVIVTTRANDAIMIVREMVKQRYEPMGLISPGSPGFYDEQFYRVLDKFSDYCITNLPWVDPQAPLSSEIEAAFGERYPGDRFDGYLFNIGFTIEAILVAVDAHRRAGSTRSTGLLEALRSTDLTDRVMIGGPIRFDEKGQNPDIASAAVQNRGLRPTVVLPAEVAELPPVFPMPGWRDRS